MAQVFRGLTTRRLAVAVLLLALCTASLREAWDTDMWWHLATGRYIVEQRTIPHEDVFSYTAAGQRWIAHEWLTDVLMYALYSAGGTPALIVAASLVVTATFALVYFTSLAGASATAGVQPYAAVFTVLIAAFASAITWGARPQLLNALLLALFQALLRAGVLWPLPLLTLLWVNLHSGFLLGLVLIGIVLVGNGLSNVLAPAATGAGYKLRHLALILVLCVLAAFVNPNGYHMLLYPFGTLGSRAMQSYIQEWASPDFHLRAYWPFALLLLGGALVLVLAQHKGTATSVTDLLLFFGFGFAGLVSARHIPLFAVVAAPPVARALGRLLRPLLRSDGRGWPLLNWALLLLLIAGPLWRLPKVLEKERQLEHTRYPADALEFIREHGLAGKRMYNSYNWGGYLIWNGLPVFIDGRADVYGDAFIHDYMLAYWLLGDWRVPLDKYGVDYILIESELPLARLLEETDEWVRVYRDEVAVVYVKGDGHFEK
ncbi:MAG: hypothetical protein N2508_06995 [Anaerolineae bacterium]|nr:hypothetical protein [Anaerolineae bacterium]